MKTIIKEIKNFKRLTKLNESNENESILIGDDLAYTLESSDFLEIPDLKSRKMTIDGLIEALLNQDTNNNVSNVFFSIGSEDDFKNKQSIPDLISVLYEKFPNANINALRPIVNQNVLDADEQTTESKIFNYYHIFEKNGIKVLGGLNSLDIDLNDSNGYIENLKSEINSTLFKNLNNNKIDIIDLDTPDYQDNIDIFGEDDSDFDTIEEFIYRFSEIVKSKNYYDVETNSNYSEDIRQIQIALAFLNYDTELNTDGDFNRQTQNAVYEYQKNNILTPTGILDHETLEEMLYDLKSRRFNGEDLSMYINVDNVEKDINRFTGSVDSVWKSFTDKIIDKFEGGYWNRDRTKPNDEKCLNHPYIPMYDNSGETMFGIDRRAGGWDKNSAGREFFGLIDDEKENYKDMTEFCKTWDYNYFGGGLREDLKLRAAALMKTEYDRLSSEFTKEARNEVESNKNLLFHFAYACWNGSGHFQNFARDINDAVSDGKTGDELIDVAVESRNNSFNGTAWERGNKKVVEIIKNKSDL